VAFFQNALGAPDQLRQRIAFALSEIWVVSNLELQNASAFPPLLNIFQNRAFDNYEGLMYDVTLNPAMGRYLNMANNDKGLPATKTSPGTSPNENYAREIMQLFTIGLTQLNINGTPVLDSNNNPVPTYTQSTVDELAKAFTGWTYPPMPGAVTKGHNPIYYLAPMVPLEYAHDLSAKTLFPGVTLPAGQTSEEDLTAALHAIFLQPSIAPFISKQLIQHLVTSNPSSPYLNRVAEVFENNGSGVRGDLKAVVHAILTDPEAREGDKSLASDITTFGHLSEPVLFVANLLRGLNGSVADSSIVYNYATTLGQQLFYAPSVFSYFSPQSRAPGGLLGPEFQIDSTQTSANRAGLVNSAIYAGHLDAGTTFDLSSFVTAASSPAQANLINLINLTFFHGSMSNNVLNAINSAMAAVPAPADKAKAALYIALTSSEFQVSH
jgi:uncharacterized protein (DUF1800 family)